MGMVLGGLVERKFGGRAGALIGSVIYTVGVGSTFYSIQHSYAATLMTMGGIASVGSSIAYSSILPTAQRVRISL